MGVNPLWYSNASGELARGTVCTPLFSSLPYLGLVQSDEQTTPGTAIRDFFTAMKNVCVHVAGQSC